MTCYDPAAFRRCRAVHSRACLPAPTVPSRSSGSCPALMVHRTRRSASPSPTCSGGPARRGTFTVEAPLAELGNGAASIPADTPVAVDVHARARRRGHRRARRPCTRRWQRGVQPLPRSRSRGDDRRPRRRAVRDRTRSKARPTCSTTTSIDLEPLVRDALLLELPLAPLCRADCAGCARPAASTATSTPCDCAHRRARPPLGGACGRSRPAHDLTRSCCDGRPEAQDEPLGDPLAQVGEHAARAAARTRCARTAARRGSRTRCAATAVGTEAGRSSTSSNEVTGMADGGTGNRPVIAIDAMGGDRAPGGDRRRRACARWPSCDVDILLVGPARRDRRHLPGGRSPAGRRGARRVRSHRDGRRARDRGAHQEGLLARAVRRGGRATAGPRRWSAPATPARRWPPRCCACGRIRGVHRPAIAVPLPVFGDRSLAAPRRRRRDGRSRTGVARRVGACSAGSTPACASASTSRRSGCCRTARKPGKGDALRKARVRRCSPR